MDFFNFLIKFIPFFIILMILFFLKRIFIEIPIEFLNHMLMDLKTSVITVPGILLSTLFIVLIATLRRIFKDRILLKFSNSNHIRKFLIIILDLSMLFRCFILSNYIFNTIPNSSYIKTIVCQYIMGKWRFLYTFILALLITIILNIIMKYIFKLFKYNHKTKVSKKNNISNNINNSNENNKTTSEHGIVAEFVQKHKIDTHNISSSTIIYNFIKNNGINLYSWERECWKCHKKTTVMSYFIDYDIEQASESIDLNTSFIGIGYLPSVDNYLAKTYKNIELKYSKSSDCEYVCVFCK
ncbi:hypothetical protein JYG23_00290 [Sedimentibacter sp. zth1]|uniref:hypothetical protein n=1 Tax=Sedimentibacter sp. zth1 TaxID=2816908 RepID=UPI001A924AC5|nr:hypothetical protein [Sedimentibacter sp. zth1]QSX05942.1 hypothetical protein JYG23_00290 [Sedimentibacter sp. zth1]